MNKPRLLRAACCWSLVALVPMLGCKGEEGDAETQTNGSSTAGNSGEQEQTAAATAGEQKQTPKKPANERLIGTWNLSFVYDEDSAKAFFKLEGIDIDEEIEKQIPAMVADGQNMKISREWRDDGTTTLSIGGAGGTKDISGTWKIASESGDLVEVEITPEGRNRAETYKLTFQNDDAYVPTESPALKKIGLKSMTFKRSR